LLVIGFQQRRYGAAGSGQRNGSRLDFKVTNGRYQGTTGEIGFDGLWKAPEGNDVIVEVKTTDAYRISLDTIAGYCTRLQEQGTSWEERFNFARFGPEDTGELEAQVRGSRHAALSAWMHSSAWSN
jgi:hypothetical protein